MLCLSAAAGPRAQAGVGQDWPPPSRAEVTLVGDEAVRGPVQEVIGELLSREGVSVTWWRLDRLRLEDVLAEPAARGGAGAPVSVWIDLGSRAEAKIYFRAAGGRRFVIRRVSFEAGPSAVAVEEIAQIVQSVLRALGSGTAWALSLSEARAALAEPPPPAGLAEPASASATVEIGSQLVGGLYAPQLPLAGRVDVSIAALARRSAASAQGWPGSLGGWLALGYGLPERFAGGTAVGADLQTAALRAGLLWEPWRDGRWAIRAVIGGGVDRVAYTPVIEMPGAAPAPSDAFYSAVGALGAALHLELGRHAALTVGALAEVSLARVHYDAYDSSGALEEVLVPYRLRPALALGAEFRP